MCPESPSSKDSGLPIIHVVDDDISVRESLTGLIRSAGWQVETYVSARDFLLRKPATTHGCLILDVRLPDLSGLDLQAELALLPHPLPVIFITGHGDIPMTVRAMKAGAAEFLPKPFRDQDLLAAIGQALAASREALMTKAASDHLHACYSSLTPREREIFHLVTQGLLNKQIAGQLGISEVTIKTHRGQVMRKMHAQSLADLVRMADKVREAPH